MKIFIFYDAKKLYYKKQSSIFLYYGILSYYHIYVYIYI